MFRESLNMTQRELAQELGVELNTVSRRELGQIQVSTEAEIAIKHIASLRRQTPRYSLRQRAMARFRVGDAVGKGRVYQYRIEGLPRAMKHLSRNFPIAAGRFCAAFMVCKVIGTDVSNQQRRLLRCYRRNTTTRLRLK